MNIRITIYIYICIYIYIYVYVHILESFAVTCPSFFLFLNTVWAAPHIHKRKRGVKCEVTDWNCSTVRI